MIIVGDEAWKDCQKKQLQDINDSLRPDATATGGKVGIFVDGQNGDLMTVMSVLKYREMLFPGKQIIWYCNMPQADALKFAPITEVRPYPWPGNGLPKSDKVYSENEDLNTFYLKYPEAITTFYPMLCDFTNNRLNKRHLDFDLTADLEEGHFPATWACLDKGKLDYPSISRRHFGFDESIPWHPVLHWSDEEVATAKEFMDKLPRRKTIMIETFGGSGQTHWDHKNTMAVIKNARQIWGDCTFLFPSHKYLRLSYEFPDELKNDPDVVFCSHFTVRQVALLINYCDLMVCVSSGISVATSAWGLKPTPKLQFCGSWKCSTITLATGEAELVDHGDHDQDKNNSLQRKRFEEKLVMMLNKYK